MGYHVVRQKFTHVSEEYSMSMFEVEEYTASRPRWLVKTLNVAICITVSLSKPVWRVRDCLENETKLIRRYSLSHYVRPKSHSESPTSITNIGWGHGPQTIEMIGNSSEFRNQTLAIHITGHLALRTEHIWKEMRAGMDRSGFQLWYDIYIGQEAGSSTPPQCKNENSLRIYHGSQVVTFQTVAFTNRTKREIA